MHSISPLTFGLKKDGSPNPIFDSLNRVVCSFPEISTTSTGGRDTRKGSPYTMETMQANARLFTAAPALLAALNYLLEQTVDQDLAHGITLTEGEADARQQALAIFAALGD